MSPTGRPIRARTIEKKCAPSAMPIRNIARIKVKTYVELPVPDERSRVHRTW